MVNIPNFPPAGAALNLLNHTGSYCSQAARNACGKTNEELQNKQKNSWGRGVRGVGGGGGILWFMGRHCVRSIPKIKNTTTTAAINTDGNKKLFPPKRCGVGVVVVVFGGGFH